PLEFTVLLTRVMRSAPTSLIPYVPAPVTVLPVTTMGCSASPFATRPSLPLAVMCVSVTLSRTQVPGVDEQFAGLKKLLVMPLAPAAWMVLESTENGESLLLMPSLLVFEINVRANVNLKLDASGLPLMGSLSSEMPVLA